MQPERSLVRMDAAAAERHVRAFKLAAASVQLGARLRTIARITGVDRGELVRYFGGGYKQCGRTPASPEWYHTANLLNRAEASIFVAIYRRLRALGFPADESLICGYKHYLGVCRGQPRVCFDRAFDLVCHSDGIWLADAPSLDLIKCPVCSSHYVAALGDVAGPEGCVFCKLVKRYLCISACRRPFPRDPCLMSHRFSFACCRARTSSPNSEGASGWPVSLSFR